MFTERAAGAGVCVFLVATVWLVFGQVRLHGFVNYDDDVYVYRNEHVTSGLTSQNVAWAFTHVRSSNWHPLTWLSHMLDCQLYGLNPAGHHITNLLIHTAAAMLLFLVLRQMTGSLWRSAFVAAVFAIHPLHVESVAWIAERKDVLSGLLFVLTIWVYVRYSRMTSSLLRYLLVLLMLALALMSKPMVVTLPLVLLLLDFWPLKRFASAPGWRLVVEKLPLLALSCAACVVTLFAQEKAMSTLPLSARAANAVVSCATYLGEMFYPTNLAVFYPHPENSLDAWKIITASLLLMAITVAAVALRRRQPWILFGWMWYLIMLVPVIGLLQVGAQAHADRYAYLPQIGLYVALAWTVADVCRGWRYRPLALNSLAGVTLVALVICARAQTAYWRNSESLWNHALACTRGNIVAHDNLGNALFENGKVDEAITNYEDALELKPDHAEAHYNLGNALCQKGRFAEAINHFRRALELKPDDPKIHYNLGIAFLRRGATDEAIAQFQQALRITPDDVVIRNNLGNTLFQCGKTNEAIAQFRAVLQARPDNAEARYNLGYALVQAGCAGDAILQFNQVLAAKPNRADAHYSLASALLQTGRGDEAIAQFEQALRIRPDWAEAQYDYGLALLRNGGTAEAIAHFQEALRIRTNYPEAENNLAWLLATSPQAALRNGGRAVELAERANELTGGADLDVLGTLAAAYAEAGQFDNAIRSAQTAIKLARVSGHEDQLAQLNGELKLYQAGLPFHQANQ